MAGNYTYAPDKIQKTAKTVCGLSWEIRGRRKV